MHFQLKLRLLGYEGSGQENLQTGALSWDLTQCHMSCCDGVMIICG